MTEPFLWGVATSAYQLEGGPASDWARWEEAGRLNARHERCGSATGHERQWESDFALLPSIGANAYRLSVEWSRIEPRRGAIDGAALGDLRRRLENLRALGVEPMLTLFHYTHPAWFWDLGWDSPEGRKAFGGFVARVADAAGDLVSWYSVLNEPLVFLLGGFLDGCIPPGRRSFAEGARALEGMLHAHVETAAVLKGANPRARFGMAHNMLDFAPERPGAWTDRRLAAAADRFYNRALIEAMATGEVDLRLPLIGRERFSVEGLPESLDFVGVNYYSRIHLRFPGRARVAGDFSYRDRHGRGLTDLGWEIHPAGLAAVLAAAGSIGLPVVITENGIATRNDAVRADFLREHALVLRHARSAGLDLRGYFHWSLLDNFEWLEGFAPRFGLFEVDYATFARRRRPSADVFAELGKGFLRENFTRL
jgi:beta-glucosidase